MDVPGFSSDGYYLYCSLACVGLQLEKCPHLQGDADIHIRDDTVYSSSDSENME